jgi:hypothetical protein
LSVVSVFEIASGVLAPLVARLRGSAVLLQAAQGEGLTFDPFALQQDFLTVPKLTSAGVRCRLGNEGLGLGFQIARQVVVL